MQNVNYHQLAQELSALTDGVPYETANLANAAALLWQNLPDINWTGFYKMEDGRLVITGNNGIDDMAGMQLKTPVTVPFLVRMRMKTTRNNVHIYFGDGCITFRKHPHTYDSLYIRDNAIGLYYGYDQKGEVEPDTFFTLEWLVGKDRFAVAVDGEVRHYGENYPYMHMPSLWKDSLRFGTADGNTLTIENMVVMEVE